MRTPIIAGNWKMNNTTAAGQALVKDLAALVADVKDRQIVVCVPFTILGAMKEAVAGTNIALGAQNLHWEKSGAYTGEISADMLLDMGVEYVLIGHSERRQYFAETDETVNKKVHTAFASGITPIVCVGETLEEREGGIMPQVISTQVEKGLAGLTGEQIKQLVIAYEPVWAIGTGRTATADQANEVCALIRSKVAELFCAECANEMRIQYGGSVKPDNAAEIMGKSDIDGALVGGAALKADSFSQIVKY
ncbi:MAG: triose-phosphate isomerase [Selenomonadales bacterium]|nr:triose-phosphate isomerase [Selenomonadales bacterium]